MPRFAYTIFFALLLALPAELAHSNDDCAQKFAQLGAPTAEAELGSPARADLEAYARSQKFLGSPWYREGKPGPKPSNMPVPDLEPGYEVLLLVQRGQGPLREIHGRVLFNQGSAALIRDDAGKEVRVDLRDVQIKRAWFRLGKAPVPAASFTKALPEIEVDSQCAGTCWAHRELYEQNFLAKQAGSESPKFSLNYLLYRKLTDMESIEQKGIEEGGYEFEVENLIEKYGVIRTEDWAPKGGSVESIYSEAVAKIKALRSDYFAKSKALQNLPREEAQVKDKALRDELERSIREFVETRTGIPPAEVRIGGKSLSPMQARDLLVPPHDRLKVEIQRGSPRNDGPIASSAASVREAFDKLQAVIRSEDRLSQTMTLAEPRDSLSLIQRAIDEGRPINIDARFDPRSIDLKSGRIVYQPGMVAPPDTNHAARIVGYALDENGKIIRLKIENSWGSKSGQNGYFDMDVEYLLQNMNRLAVDLPKAPATP